MKFDPSRFIWSADVTPAELRAVVSAKVIPPEIGVKLDTQFVIVYGLAATIKEARKRLSQFTLEDLQPNLDFYHSVGAVQDAGHPIFGDFKLSEIPTKVEGTVENGISYFSPDMVNCMAGSLYTTELWEDPNPQKIDGLKRYATSCINLGIYPCAVTVLSSKNDDPNTGVVFKEFRRRAKKQVRFYADLLVEAGFTDLVCSAQEAAYLRQFKKYDSLRLNCPGIRLPDSDVRDQARIMTPQKALEIGIERLVVGSDLTGDPEQEPDIVKRVAANLERIIAHIEGED